MFYKRKNIEISSILKTTFSKEKKLLFPFYYHFLLQIKRYIGRITSVFETIVEDVNYTL